MLYLLWQFRCKLLYSNICAFCAHTQTPYTHTHTLEITHCYYYYYCLSSLQKHLRSKHMANKTFGEYMLKLLYLLFATHLCVFYVLIYSIKNGMKLMNVPVACWLVYVLMWVCTAAELSGRRGCKNSLKILKPTYHAQHTPFNRTKLEETQTNLSVCQTILHRTQLIWLVFSRSVYISTRQSKFEAHCKS